jgi:hypothetical protein
MIGRRCLRPWRSSSKTGFAVGLPTPAAVDGRGSARHAVARPVERAVGEALVVEVLAAVRAVLRLRVGGPARDLEHQDKWSRYSR